VLAGVRADLARLPAVVTVSDPAGALQSGPEAAVAAGAVSPDGRVALVTLRYPVIEELSAGDLADLKKVLAAHRDRPAHGDCVVEVDEPVDPREVVDAPDQRLGRALVALRLGPEGAEGLAPGQQVRVIERSGIDGQRRRRPVRQARGRDDSRAIARERLPDLIGDLQRDQSASCW
jgi:ribosomal protein S28E/S33